MEQTKRRWELKVVLAIVMIALVCIVAAVGIKTAQAAPAGTNKSVVINPENQDFIFKSVS